MDSNLKEIKLEVDVNGFAFSTNVKKDLNAKYYAVQFVPLLNEQTANEFVLKNLNNTNNIMIIPSNTLYTPNDTNPLHLDFSKYLLMNGQYTVEQLANAYLKRDLGYLHNSNNNMNNYIMHELQHKVQTLEHAVSTQLQFNNTVTYNFNELASKTSRAIVDMSESMNLFDSKLNQIKNFGVIRATENITTSLVPSLVDSRNTIQVRENAQIIETSKVQLSRTNVNVTVPLEEENNTYATVTLKGQIIQKPIERKVVDKGTDLIDFSSNQFPDIDAPVNKEKEKEKDKKNVKHQNAQGNKLQTVDQHIVDIDQKYGLLLEKVKEYNWKFNEVNESCKVAYFKRDVSDSELNNAFGVVVSFGYLQDDYSMQFAIIAKNKTITDNLVSNSSFDIIMSKKMAIALGFETIETEIIIVPLIRRPQTNEDYKSGAYIGMYSCLHKKRKMTKYHNVLNALSDLIVQYTDQIGCVIQKCLTAIFSFFGCFTSDVLSNNLKNYIPITPKTFNYVKVKHNVSNNDQIVNNFISKIDQACALEFNNCINRCKEAECAKRGLMYGSKIQKNDGKYVSPCGEKFDHINNYYNHYCTVRGRAVRFANPDDSKYDSNIKFKCARCFRIYNNECDKVVCSVFCEVIGKINNSTYTTKADEQIKKKINSVVSGLKHI